jgi:GGDEF domain-containing protein
MASIVGLSPSGVPLLPEALAGLCLPGPIYPNADALLGAESSADASMLYPADAQQAAQWLWTLRSDARFALRPLFVSRSFGEAADALCDGVIESPAQAAERIAQIQDRQAILPVRDPLDPEQRLLCFLFTRPERIVAPCPEWRSEHIYHYPLLDVFAPPGAAGFEWALALRRRSLLEPVALVDRIRLCPACFSAHLNFIDLCPQCGSIDIGETLFLHCYACGHVAEQDLFLSGSGLACAKCSARLRHIGVDYDRALESFSCAGCAGRFTEPEVKVRCFQCHKLAGTDELQARRIDSYRISETGQLVARTGQVGDLFALIDEFNCVHPAYFEQTIDFMLKLSRRHGEIEFGLLCLRFSNLRELLTRLPRPRVTQLVDAFSARLRELVRTTDMVLRSDDEYCWLLLPQTPLAGLNVLLGRVEKIARDVLADPETSLTLSISAVASRSVADRRAEAKMLMAELREQVG